MRTISKADPRAASARVLLAELLIGRGGLAEAERGMVKALSPDSTGAETSRIEVLLKLIERGRYGRALERALLSRVGEVGASDRILSDWSELFSALLCGCRYQAAFRLGEAVLDRSRSLTGFRSLLWPWWRKVGRGVAERSFCARELRRLRSAETTGGFPHWFAYCRAVLLNCLGEDKEAMAEFKSIRDLDGARYAWMSQPFVQFMLVKGDLDGTVELCRRVLRHAPDYWLVHCRMAEAHLIRGATAEGLREFKRAEDTSDVNAKREVLTWHGEALLWLGKYRRALDKLNEAVGLGARTFVHGWRGAAYLKLGNLQKALEDLDRAIELDGKDFEARLWRGEARRLLGRHAEALKDLDYFIRYGSPCLWGFFNRALVKNALGDEAGAAADYRSASAAMPDEEAFIRGKLGWKAGKALGAAERRKVMEEGLRLAKGVRRWEKHLGPVWMERK